jgi:hypothetical protein
VTPRQVEQGERRPDVMEFARLCREIGCDAGEGLQLVAPPAAEEGLRKVTESRAVYRARRPIRSTAKSAT